MIAHLVLITSIIIILIHHFTYEGTDIRKIKYGGAWVLSP